MNQRMIVLCSAVLSFFHLPAMAENAAKPAPNCALTAFSDKKTLDLQQFKGKVVYLDFWASWCAPCAQSFPFMNTLQHEFSDKGLQIVAVNMDENLTDAQDFLNKYPPHFSIAIDKDQQCAKAFSVKAMPSSYLIDRNGIIRYEHLGFRSGETEELKKLVAELIKQ